jgi:hypothetical protein
VFLRPAGNTTSARAPQSIACIDPMRGPKSCGCTIRGTFKFLHDRIDAERERGDTPERRWEEYMCGTTCGLSQSIRSGKEGGQPGSVDELYSQSGSACRAASSEIYFGAQCFAQYIPKAVSVAIDMQSRPPQLARGIEPRQSRVPRNLARESHHCLKTTHLLPCQTYPRHHTFDPNLYWSNRPHTCCIKLFFNCY